MGSTNLINIPQREAPIPAGTGEKESMGETRLLDTDRQRVVEAELRVCPQCHYVLGNAHSLDTNELARIDVFDLPNENDVRCTHDRVH